jgi:hypothetical protein
MEDYQVRVVEEKVKLDRKLKRLYAFIGGPTFDGLKFGSQHLLVRQAEAMEEYSDILAARIEGF